MLSPLSIYRNFSLRDCNTFGVDVTASAYLKVESVQTLEQVREDAQLCQLRKLILGGGSNILPMHHFPGLVLHMSNKGIAIVGEDADVTYVRAAAGENWHAFVQWTLARDLPGLENLSLIPGSVGAAPIQNIGAYGVEIKDYLHSITAFDFDSGEVFTMRRDECGFAYRDSVFKHRLRNKAVILDVTFALPKRWQPNTGYADVAKEIEAMGWANPTACQIADAVIAIRMRKLPDPAVIGNAGSFFKNPIVSSLQRNTLLETYPGLPNYPQPDGSYKLAAGWLIDQCGWKGKSLGRAGVYAKQALVLVNLGGATGEEITQLAAKIQADVQLRFGVMLEPEPVFIA
jgi:UDP-N-acetylmuramate dehydrogenase